MKNDLWWLVSGISLGMPIGLAVAAVIGAPWTIGLGLAGIITVKFRSSSSS